MKVKLMKCEIKNREQLIEDYVSGNLSPQEKELFDEHCFNCDICFSELRFKENCINLIKEEGSILLADYLKKQETQKKWRISELLKKKIDYADFIRNKKWVYATAFVGTAAILFVFLFQYQFRSHEEKKLITNKSQSEISPAIEKTIDTSQMIETETLANELHQTPTIETPQKSDSELDISQTYTNNFTPLPYLEQMVADITRSHSITVLSPKINEKMKGNILFHWEIVHTRITNLKILNNKGIEIFKTTARNNQFIFSEKLEPGLYYWKIEDEDELLYLGKFIMEEIK